jgi:hypothetical protein
VTVMIPTFFGIHPHVIRSGLWARMKPGEKDLYIALMEISERWCTREIRATDAEIAEAVGVEPRTLCNARKKLCEYGLVRCGDLTRAGHLYIICKPESGLPYPGDPKTPIKYQRKASESNGAERPRPVQTDPETTLKSAKPYGMKLEF